MISVPGAWKNFDDIEESLTMPELESLVTTARKMRQDDQRFMAALKGIDLDKNSENDVEAARKRVETRAKAKLAGMDEDTYELSSLGIQFNQE